MSARTRERYSRQRVDEGLTALIVTENETRAHEMTGIPQQTLSDWRRTKADRILELREELEPRIVKVLAAGAEEVALKLTERERQIADALTPDVIAQLKPAELAATLRNLSTSKALQIDKISSPLRERPSHVQQGFNVVDLVTQLSSRLGFDATSTATEITDEPSSLPLSVENGALNARS